MGRLTNTSPVAAAATHTRETKMVSKRFASHFPGAKADALVKELRQAYSDLEAVLKKVPDSREKSLAITDLEASAMWATKAAVITDPESTQLMG